ncbi:MAG: preprotein translocase subunit SecY [Pseudomonadota bacterium]|nr:preprotein translocase subunit SecY [Pseudomonadota bacterium]
MSKFSLLHSGVKELQSRLLFVFIAIVVFRIGTHIPIPGVDLEQIGVIFAHGKTNSILGYFDMFTGGAMSKMSLLTLGIMPYVTASIVIQLLSYSLPKLQDLRKQGESGRQIMNQYTRYLTVILSLVQGFTVTQLLVSKNLILVPYWLFTYYSTITLCTGTMFLMWMGDQITRYGVGNGTSLILFSGIVSRFPEAISRLVQQAKLGQIHSTKLLMVLALVISVISFIVYMERGQRQLQLTYPKRQQLANRVNKNSSKLPLKINMVSVMPPIIAQTLILFPVSIGDFLAKAGVTNSIHRISMYLQPGEPLYMITFVGMVVLFAFYMTAMMYSTDEIADQLKKGGALIGGIRPGKNTAEYIDKILTKLTLFGGIYLAFVALLPDIVIRFLHVPLPFGGTSLLISVVIVIEFMSQVQTYLLPGHVESVRGRSASKLKLLH